MMWRKREQRLRVHQACLVAVILALAQISNAQEILGTRFIDPVEENVIPLELTPNNTLEYETIGTDRVNILFESNEATESVAITLDQPPISICERRRPFAIFPNSFPTDGGPHGLGKFRGRKIPYGQRVVRAIPYDGTKCTGEAGPIFELVFDVVRPGEVIATTTTTTTAAAAVVSTATIAPSAAPSAQPTAAPSAQPTAAPTTAIPSISPTTEIPTTVAPVTSVPVTTSPVTSEPVDLATASPVSASPVSSEPVDTTTVAPVDLSTLQPKITTVESFPARKIAGILDLGTQGTPWCGGNPTYWTPGHKSDNDTPNCLVNGTWTRPFTAHMDDNDDLNDLDGPEVIDRHDCGVIDANDDGLLDVYCLVGANSGRGHGFNELYLTQADGSIVKAERHGLQKHFGMRGRHTNVVNGPNGTQFVFMATKGVKRSDDLENSHRMFRRTGVAPDYFVEEPGPWVSDYTTATFSQSIDLNGDGLEDVLVGNIKAHALVYMQGLDSNGNTTWTKMPMTETRRQWNWRTARVADFSGDGIPDLLVVYWGDRAYLRVLYGIPEAPYFDFLGQTYYSGFVPFAIPDVEVMDVNDDGILDFYVVQSDEVKRNEDGSDRQGVYCAGKFFHREWWPRGNQPPPDFEPPRDLAQDILFLGRSPSVKKRDRYEQIFMEHAEPGCGNLVRPFGHKKLLLTQGDFVRPGHQLVLDWN